MRKHFLLMATAIIAVALLCSSAAWAFDSGGTPSGIGPDSINWTGNGSPVSQQCDSSADPGQGGYQNGATATNYMLWILNTDGGSISGGWTLTVNGTTYGNSSANQLVTPYIDPTGAVANFTVATTGTGAWILTISHGCQGAQDLTVSKTATPSFDRSYSWNITKDVDKTHADVTPGSTATFNYTVGVSHGSAVDSNFAVTGTIEVDNPNSFAVSGVNVTDTTNVGGTCTVTGGTNITVAAGGSTVLNYSCTFASNAGAGINTATANWPDIGSPHTSATGTAAFDFGTVSPNLIDNCVSVSDPIDPNSPHSYCVGDTGDPNFSFTYSRTVSAPSLGTCVDYDNTATFTTNTTGTTGSASKTVTVCAFNAPLTIGYWKTHISQCAPHVKTGTGGCNNNGPFTVQYLPQPLGNYVVSTGDKALAVFNANNCSSATDQGAVGCLAAQLLAAELNVANHSNTCISSTIAAANAFLVSVGYTGPTGTYTLTSAQRTQALTLKTALDTYNNGGGC
jgi:hypothetical protein